jgi:hypothetical protein
LGDDRISFFRAIRAANRTLHGTGEFAVQRFDIKLVFAAARAKNFYFHSLLWSYRAKGGL